jgi:hypothetical protein
LCKPQHLDKRRFWSAFKLLIDVDNFSKLKQFHKSRYWNALNWQIHLGNFYNFEQQFKWRFRLHLIAQ